MLDIKKTLAKLLNCDYVIEEGQSGIWTYRKWASGIAECWGEIRNTPTKWTKWGELYYSEPVFNGIYPNGLFLDAPSVTGQVSTRPGADCIVGVGSGGTAGNTPTFYFFRPTTANTGTNGGVSIHAIGLWKTSAHIVGGVLLSSIFKAFGHLQRIGGGINALAKDSDCKDTRRTQRKHTTDLLYNRHKHANGQDGIHKKSRNSLYERSKRLCEATGRTILEYRDFASMGKTDNRADATRPKQQEPDYVQYTPRWDGTLLQLRYCDNNEHKRSIQRLLDSWITTSERRWQYA